MLKDFVHPNYVCILIGLRILDLSHLIIIRILEVIRFCFWTKKMNTFLSKIGWKSRWTFACCQKQDHCVSSTIVRFVRYRYVVFVSFGVKISFCTCRDGSLPRTQISFNAHKGICICWRYVFFGHPRKIKTKST